ncbi:ribonuclease HIII [Mycoplasma sp. NEAQ87857]|uniref:ribonuclease HIII n=1 Tax=Mycoplasma sp. NEAQ87857 TaxID=2683967 RepID=UPI001319A18D|nr:ribonuclease HIII [Mycoplasma sp. NEAQ87857]QGZ97191.1 ribonuclease HIII [Mycoplasma sp. NEAQ87857]
MRFFDDINKFNLNNELILGVDETGVGDYFTPIIACSCIVKDKQLLNDLDIKDSKKLSDKQILKIAPIIMKKVDYSVYKLTQEGYNKLTSKYNANEIKFFIHQHSINNLLNKINYLPSLILIDKYSTTNSILKYYDKLLFQNNWSNLKDFDINTLLLNKAEDIDISVACASIIARYFLLKHMEEQNKEWKFDFLFGASTKVKDQITEFSNLYGENNLIKVLKLNFKR